MGRIVRSNSWSIPVVYIADDGHFARNEIIALSPPSLTDISWLSAKLTSAGTKRCQYFPISGLLYN